MYLYSLLSSKAKWYPVLFDSPLNAVRSIAIWLTLALLIGFGVCALLFKEEKRKKFFKISLLVAVGYACVVGGLYLVLSFMEDGVQTILFVPLLILLLCILASAIVLLFKRTQAVYIFVGSVLALAFIAALVCMAVHFSSGVAAENNGMTKADVGSTWLYLFAAALIAAVLAVAFLLDKRKLSAFSAKEITYAGVCIAMSFALSYMRIVRMPQGGSITPASILPLMIFAYAFGAKKGVFIGFIYGLLQGFQDPYILHPAQFLLDYPVAYACVGLAGVFNQTHALRNSPQLQIALGGLLAGGFRFLMHFISGIFAFGVFAPEGTNVALYSLGYQAGYILPDIAIAIAAAAFVFSSKAFVKELKKFHGKAVATEEKQG